MPSETIIQHREAAFHDAWAKSTRVEDVLVRECFEAPTALENQFILHLMGPLSGKSLLDIGAGLGESSLYFALQGARVTVVDISPQMVETAPRLGNRHAAHLHCILSDPEHLHFHLHTPPILY